MSKKDALTLAARVVAIYLFCWAVVDVTYLPERIFSLSHYVTQHSVLSADQYFRNLELLQIALILVRVIGLLLASAWFFRGGPGIERILLGRDGAAVK